MLVKDESKKYRSQKHILIEKSIHGKYCNNEKDYGQRSPPYKPEQSENSIHYIAYAFSARIWQNLALIQSVNWYCHVHLLLVKSHIIFNMIAMRHVRTLNVVNRTFPHTRYIKKSKFVLFPFHNFRCLSSLHLIITTSFLLCLSSIK